VSRRIGLLGGTFDPVHLGHVAAALAVRDRLALDRVVLVPSRVPPHRPSQPRASAFHRFAMACLAAQEHERLAASDVELLSSGPSYTIDTLAAFQGLGYDASQLFFITGADAFAEIATWRQYPSLLDAANFVVVSRPGHDLADIRRRVPDAMARLVDLRECTSAAATIPGSPAVFFVHAATPDVSSTTVRRLLAEGEPIDHLVAASVRRHIERHGLYRPQEAAVHLHG
jgi:nicotinate-nucleotide adenylyltransferase